MPVFDSGYPENSTPADADLILTTDTSDSKAVKSVKFSSLRTWLINTTKWITRAMIGDGEVPVLRDTRYYTASDTWTKPSGMTANGFVRVMVLGAGGGGGGSGTDNGRGGGGGSGGLAIKKIVASSLGSTVAVTVGAAGTGAAAGNNPGTAGGDSSFGAFCTGGGGGRGEAATGSFLVNNGVATGGDLNISGQSGMGRRSGTGTLGVGLAGSSPLGFGFANPVGTAFTGGSNAGSAGTGYGAGGAGGFRLATTSAIGADGTNGLVIVEEWY